MKETISFSGPGSVVTGGEVPDDSLASQVAHDIADEHPDSVPFVMPISTPDPGIESIQVDGEEA